MQPLRHLPPGSEKLPAHHRAQQHHKRRQNLPGEGGGHSLRAHLLRRELAREADALVPTPSAQAFPSSEGEPLCSLD